MKDIIKPHIKLELPYKKDSDGNYKIIPEPKGYSGITITNKKKYPDGYLYFIKIHKQDVYKIGVSGNVKRRIQDISSNIPFELEILSIHLFKNVYDIEEELTLRYKNKNIRKEWYSFTIEEAKDIMIELHNLNVIKSNL